MSRLIKYRSKKTGLPPGTLTYIGNKISTDIKISILNYNQEHYNELIPKTIEESFIFKNSSSMTWINIDGLHNTDIINTIGENYGIHPLVLEDILNSNQRPKIEIFEDYIFIVIKMLTFNEKELKINSEQISILFGKNFVISFQEQTGDILNLLKERIKNSKGKIRKNGSDYLAYAILDIIVDYYFNILEKIGDKIEHFEEKLMHEPHPETLNEIYRLKREVLHLRRSIWPLRESIMKFERAESKLIHKKTMPYLKDLYDHTIQAIDLVETSRDLLAGMLDLYLSSVSNKMNEIMKTLTIFAAIFIPLTFIAGVYGMNFEIMPELKWEKGYLMVWIIFITMTGSLIIYFKNKKWI